MLAPVLPALTLAALLAAPASGAAIASSALAALRVAPASLVDSPPAVSGSPAGARTPAVTTRPSRPAATRLAGDSLRSDKEVRAAVLRNTNDVRRCYETEGLPRNPALTGSMELALTILPTGVVSRVRVDSLALEGPGAAEVARCVLLHARHWRFERGAFDTETHVFPFNFAPEPVKGIAGGRRGA